MYGESIRGYSYEKRSEERIGPQFLLGLRDRLAASIDRSRIDPEEDFGGLYDQEVLDAHQREVERLRLIFTTPKSGVRRGIEQETEQVKGKLLECMLMDNNITRAWYGSGLHAQGAAEYDDYKNGVDIFWEFAPEGSDLSPLAFDVTYSKDSLARKLQSIKISIEKGALSRAAYFVSGHTGYKGPLKQVPKLLMAVSPKHMERVAPLWAQKKPELTQDVLQSVILSESLMQLDTFKNYAAKIGKAEAASQYEKRQVDVTKLANRNFAKIGKGDVDALLAQDSTYQSFREQLNAFDRLSTDVRIGKL